MDVSRTALLIGEESVARLQKASVCIFGVGGVGSYAAEAVARCGVGHITIVDYDTVSPSNLNRQIPALIDTIGRQKVEVMAERMRAINNMAEIVSVPSFCTPENVHTLIPISCDYLIDAVDTVSAKLAIAETAAKRGIPLISCMGAGNKIDPSKFQITDIYKTTTCPLCRVMRHELRKRGIEKLDVVYSTEQPRPVEPGKIGSIMYVTATAGLLAASYVISKLADIK
ncbi:MAG: tRNA threonylcarbamoyladenosine dehydratase [Clostridia bacterium]|nr:tRNA threonylcarbamoyladenosine dehydratase [Clostridia bacterium]